MMTHKESLLITTHILDSQETVSIYKRVGESPVWEKIEKVPDKYIAEVPATPVAPPELTFDEIYKKAITQIEFFNGVMLTLDNVDYATEIVYDREGNPIQRHKAFDYYDSDHYRKCISVLDKESDDVKKVLLPRIGEYLDKVYAEFECNRVLGVYKTAASAAIKEPFPFSTKFKAAVVSTLKTGAIKFEPFVNDNDFMIYP